MTKNRILEGVVIAVMAAVAVAVLFAAWGAARETVFDAIEGVAEWLSEIDRIPRGVWLLALLILGLLILQAVRVRQTTTMTEGNTAVEQFRDSFMELVEWELGTLYGIVEGHDHPDDPRLESEYKSKRHNILPLHDEVGDSLRRWLEDQVGGRYDLRLWEPSEVDPSIAVPVGDPDWPIRRCFDSPTFEEALSTADGWEHRDDIYRQLGRYEETLDAYVRWTKRQEGRV